MNELVERWAAGDQRAAEELYRKYHARVKRFILSIGSKAEDPDDIAQEAMLTGLEGLRGGKRPDRLTCWLFGIAKNITRRGKRMGDLGKEAPDPGDRSARTLAMRREMKDLLDRTLESLPGPAREIVELRHRENLSRQEIAERLGLSLPAVHARCERAYARLRQALSRHFTTVIVAKARGVPLSEIRALRPSFRSAVVARHLDQLSERDAAIRIGIPPATLRARLETAYEILKCPIDPDFTLARAEYRRPPAPLPGAGAPPSTR